MAKTFLNFSGTDAGTVYTVPANKAAKIVVQYFEPKTNLNVQDRNDVGITIGGGKGNLVPEAIGNIPADRVVSINEIDDNGTLVMYYCILFKEYILAEGQSVIIDPVSIGTPGQISGLIIEEDI